MLEQQFPNQQEHGSVATFLLQLLLSASVDNENTEGPTLDESTLP
jgi:hypothetical protein